MHILPSTSCKPLPANPGRSVTATITTPNRECAYINTSALSGNQFDVFISEPGLVTTMSGGFVTSVGLLCNPIDLPFSFKVTARPPAN